MFAKIGDPTRTIIYMYLLPLKRDNEILRQEIKPIL